MADQTAVFRAIADFSSLRKESRAAIVDLKALQSAASGASAKIQGGAQGVGTAAASIGAVGAQSRKAAPGLTAVGAAAASAGANSNAASKGLEAFNRSLTQSTQRSSVFNSGLVGMIQSMGVLKSAAAGTAVTVGALTAAGAAIGIKFNAALEQAEIGFKNIFNSATQARDVIDQIVSYARVTPFDTAGLIDQTRKLTGAGFEMEEILVGSDAAATGLVVTIGDAAAAMGGGRDVADSMVQAITRIKATGRVTFEELRIFAERGVPAIEILQEKLGLTAKEVQRIGDLGIGADVAIGALTEGLNERFGGAMAEQARSALGLISTFKDNILIGMATAFEGLFETFKATLMGITDLMTEINVLSEDVGFVEALSQKLPIIGPLIKGVVDTFAALGAVMASLAPMFQVVFQTLAAGAVVATGGLEILASVLNLLAVGLNKVPDDILKFAAATMLMNKALGGIGLPLANMAAGMARMTASSPALYGMFQRLSTAAAGFGPQGLLVAAGLTAIGAAVVYTMRQGDKVEKQWKTSSETASALGKSFETLSGAIDSTTGAVDKSSSSWQDWLDETSEVRARLAEMSGEDLGTALEAMAVNLVINGMPPEDAFAQMRALADAVAGTNYELTFTADTLKGGPSQAKALAEEFQRELSNIDLSSMEITPISNEAEIAAVGDRLTELKDSASDVGTALGQMMKIDPVQAITGLVAAEQAVRDLNLSQIQTDLIVDSLNDGFREQSGAASDGGNAVSTYGNMLKWVATDASNLSAEQREMVSVFNDTLAVTGSVDQALAAMAGAVAGVETSVGGATNAIEDYGDVMITAFAAQDEAEMDRFTEQFEATTKAFEDFVDPADTFMQLLSEVSDEGKEAAQNAAINAGLSAEEWQRFPKEAGVGLKDWRVALENSLVHQRQWMDNLTEVSKKYGPEVATYFRDAGPELAGALEAVVNDTTGESDKLAAAIKEDAELASEGFVEEFVSTLETGFSDIAGTFSTAIPNISAQSAAYGAGIALGIEAGAARVSAARSSIDSNLSRPLPTLGGGGGGGLVGSPDSAGRAVGADGGFLNFARGGMLPGAGDTLPGAAKIQRGGTVVQWAEGNTGGEAFIPLGMRNRKRSLDIWQKTGRLIGALNFARGGIRRGRIDGPNISDASEGEIDGHIAGGGNGNPFARPGASGSSGSSGSGSSGSGGGVAAVAEDAEDLADAIEEAAKNFRDFMFESKSTGQQIRQLNRELSKTVQFTDEWMTLMSQRQQLFDQMRSDINSQVSTLTGLLDQARGIRESRRERRTQFRDDQTALVERRNEDIARINEDLSSRLTGITEDRDESLVDLAERRADAIANAEERLGDAMESAAEQRSDAILGLEEGLAEQREALAERTADQLAGIEANLQKSIAGRAATLAKSLDPLQRYEQAWANTTQAILDNFTAQNSQFDATLAGIRSLQQAGLSMDAISLLGLDSGPQALSQIERLRDASAAEIAELNRLAAGRESTTLQLASDISGDLFAEAATARERTLAEAADAEARLVLGYQRSLGDIQQSYDRALRDANAAHAESIADAASSYAESTAEVYAQFTESVAEATAAAAEARAEVRAQFTENLAALREDFLADMAELNAQLAGLGEDQGLTWAQAIRRGLRSGVPGIVAVAQEIQRSINQLQNLGEQSPNMPGSRNPNAPGGGGGGSSAAGGNGPGSSVGSGSGAGSRTYRIREGDSQRSIAARFNTTWDAIERMNPFMRGRLVPNHIGRMLDIPIMHTGGMVGGQGMSEVLALLQTGEGVMSREALRSIRNQGGMASPRDYQNMSGGKRPLHVQVVTPSGRVLWEFVQPFSDEDEIMRGVMSG